MNRITNTKILVAFGMATAWTGLSFALADVPEPLIEFTFEGGSLANTGTLQGAGELSNNNGERVPEIGYGLGGVGHGLDNTSASGMGSEGDGLDGALWYQPGDGLNDLQSMTITGWFKADPGNPLVNDARLVSKTGSFSLYGGSRLRFYVLDPDEERRTQSSGTILWQQETGRWTFFAVTFDGTSDLNNLVVYDSSEISAGVRSLNRTVSAGPVRNVGAEVTIGNYHFDNRPFQGRIDNVRIYGSTEDGSGALTAEQIEAIWLADLLEAEGRDTLLLEFTFDGESLLNTGLAGGAGAFTAIGDSATMPGFGPGLLPEGDGLDNTDATVMGNPGPDGDDNGGFVWVNHNNTPDRPVSNMMSVTYTGWFHTSELFANDGYLITQPNVFNIFGRNDYFRADLRDVDGNSRYVDSSSPWHQEEDRWVFYAVTFDGTLEGTSEEPNAHLYYAYADSGDVVLETTVGLPAGKIRNATHAVTLANSHWGNRPFKGLMDNVRLYASKIDASGALSSEEIREIWQQDIAAGLPAVPRLVNAVHDGQAFSFSFATEAGVEYVVERSADLLNWEPIETVTGSGAVETIVDAVPDSDREFYRVRLE